MAWAAKWKTTGDWVFKHEIWKQGESALEKSQLPAQIGHCFRKQLCYKTDGGKFN